MQQLKDFKYQRPNAQEVFAQYQTHTQQLRTAQTAAQAQAAIEDHSRLSEHMDTLQTLANIRHTMDTRDAFYDAENAFFDDFAPELEEYSVEFYRAALQSPFRPQLEEALGAHYFVLAQQAVDAFAPELIPDMQEENRLATQYQKLLASCAVEFDGETCNLYGLLKRMEDPNRTIRQRAYHAWAGFFAAHEHELDEIFGQLVRCRTEMGKKMGYENYVPLGYLNMGRLGYGREEVAAFRAQVREHIVPLCTRLRQSQAKRLGLDALSYYDEALNFKEGNAVPHGTEAELVAKAQKMYHELDPETGAFFDEMVQRGLLDLQTRPGKAIGGYCTFLPEYQAPFIFSNFNGTSADVDVLTHEAGHAYMAYCSAQHNTLPEYLWGTSELDEIHSMSMEFFTHPWMELFFGDQAEQYRFSHLADALTFVPYGVAVDEFQHLVYENPNWTPAQRKAAWRQLEHTYLPHRQYDGEDLFERGGFWFRQLHIFLHPFYYIDYTLATMGAFEFFARMQQDAKNAFSTYRALCHAGGRDSYLHLLKEFGLQNPFIPGSVEKTVEPIFQTLKQFEYFV